MTISTTRIRYVTTLLSVSIYGNERGFVRRQLLRRSPELCRNDVIQCTLRGRMQCVTAKSAKLPSILAVTCVEFGGWADGMGCVVGGYCRVRRRRSVARFGGGAVHGHIAGVEPSASIDSRCRHIRNNAAVAPNGYATDDINSCSVDLNNLITATVGGVTDFSFARFYDTSTGTSSTCDGELRLCSADERIQRLPIPIQRGASSTLD